MDTQETEQAKNLRMKNLEHVRALWGVVRKDSSLARSAFERLSKNQKRYLLIASGLDQHISWEHLSNEEIKLIQKGIKRLELIVNHFKNCKDNDFQKAQVPKNKNNNEQALDELKQRVDLVVQITKGTNNANQSNAVI